MFVFLLGIEVKTPAFLINHRYGEDGCSYIHDVDANINDIGRLIEGESDYVIDATTNGNVSRFINHRWSFSLPIFVLHYSTI